MLQQAIVAVLHIHWADQDMHTTGVTTLLAANRSELSLVDCVSIETMRRLGVDTAFAFHNHFAEQGFTCIPQQGNGI